METQNMETQNVVFQMMSQPDFSFLKVKLQTAQAIDVEASAMASMDTNIVMTTKMKGGIMSALKRKMAGESIFINRFSAEQGPGEICIAPGAPGDVVHYCLEQGHTIFLQSSCYIASTPSVSVDTQWGGVKGFFGGVGLMLVKASGVGDLFFNAYGSVVEIPVENGFVVDTGYIVAFEHTLQYRITMAGGLRTSMLGGEGLVCEFSGQGKLWIQTRKINPLIQFLQPFRPHQR